MPARSNDFQKLIKVINHSLAPSDAKVTESAMLLDPESETDREIDILIESKLMNCDIKIGVECTASSRPLDVRAIESFKEKHRKVGINKTIVVSKNGFSEPAKKYANKNQIKLLTFNNAKKENWSKQYERLKNLSVYARNYYLRSISIYFSDDADSEFICSESTVLLGGRFIPIHEFAIKTFQSSEVGKIAPNELMNNERDGEDQPWVEVGYDLDGKYVFRDKNGVECKPHQMVVVMDYKSTYHSLDSKQVEYDGTSLVVGSSSDTVTNKNLVSVAINEANGEYRGNIEFDVGIFPGDKT